MADPVVIMSAEGWGDPAGGEWDGDSSLRALLRRAGWDPDDEDATVDPDQVRGIAVRDQDEDKDTLAAWKGPFADVRNGNVVAVENGLQALKSRGVQIEGLSEEQANTIQSMADEILGEEDDDSASMNGESRVITGGRRKVYPEIRSDGEEGRTTVKVLANELARDGIVLRAEGVRTDNFQKNPVVLWDHGMDSRRGSEPIATAEKISRSSDGEIIAEIEWETDEFAQRIRDKVKRGSIRAVSIGWDPEETIREEVDGDRRTVVTEADMTEFSFVGVGADPDALVQERSIEALERKLDELPERMAEAMQQEDETQSETQTESSEPSENQSLTRKQKVARLIALLPRLRQQVRRKLGKA